MRIALGRAHERLHSAQFELNLSRRAVESLSRHAALERAQARDRQTELADQVARLRHYMADVERMVGPYSLACGDPKHTHASGYGDEMQLEMHRPLEFNRLGQRPDASYEAHVHRVIMRRLHVRTVQEELRGATHLRATLRDKSIAYYLSDFAIDSAPLEVIIPRIAAEMSEALIRALRAGKANVRRTTSQFNPFDPDYFPR